MNLSELFSFHYYFTPSPEISTLNTLIGLYFVLILVVKTHVRMLTGKHQHRMELRSLLKKPMKRLTWISALGIISIIGRYTGIAYISMRFWQYALVLISIIVGVQIVKIFKKDVFHVADEASSRPKVKSYLPVPKKKKKNGRR